MLNFIFDGCFLLFFFFVKNMEEILHDLSFWRHTKALCELYF